MWYEDDDYVVVNVPTDAVTVCEDKEKKNQMIQKIGNAGVSLTEEQMGCVICFDAVPGATLKDVRDAANFLIMNKCFQPENFRARKHYVGLIMIFPNQVELVDPMSKFLKKNSERTLR